jgi:hypothetical protein
MRTPVQLAALDIGFLRMLFSCSVEADFPGVAKASNYVVTASNNWSVTHVATQLIRLSKLTVKTVNA